MAVSPRRMLDALRAAQQAIQGLPEDERLIVDTIEGESELLELLDRYAESAIADKVLADQASQRAARLRARAERSRHVILQTLLGLGLSESVRRPLYTAAISNRRYARVIDEAHLPPQYFSSAPDMAAINEALRAGTGVSGAVLSNPEPTLILKVK